MRNFRLFAERFTRTLALVPMLLVWFSGQAFGGNSISGTVRNMTRGQPAAGDEVIVLRLDTPSDTAMKEEARAKTDAQGAFRFDVQYPDKPYLVRVVHQGVSYDQPVSANHLLSIQVFDATSQLRGVTGSIEILRAGTTRNLLHISDMIEIINDSSPPVTKAGERTFEVYLPPNAKMDSALAAGPEKVSVQIPATPIPGDSGHYVVSFPLRPGATKFAFNYDIPYEGHAVFQTRHAYSLQQLAVMIPPTMKFSSRSAAFAILETGNRRYQVQAANQLQAGEGPTFEISGTGELPDLGSVAKSPVRAPTPAIPNAVLSSPSSPALSSFVDIQSPSKQTRTSAQSLLLNGVTSILLALCVLLVWRSRKTTTLSSRPRGSLGHGQSRLTESSRRL